MHFNPTLSHSRALFAVHRLLLLLFILPIIFIDGQWMAWRCFIETVQAKYSHSIARVDGEEEEEFVYWNSFAVAKSYGRMGKSICNDRLMVRLSEMFNMWWGKVLLRGVRHPSSELRAKYDKKKNCLTISDCSYQKHSFTADNHN